MIPRRVTLAGGADLAGFRQALRRLIAAGVPPQEVSWQVAGEPGLFGAEEGGEAPPVALPRRLGELIETVVCHSDPERYALLYRTAWRVTHGERALLEMPADPDMHRLALMEKSVRRDIHKMHAFLRFRRVEDEGGERFVAWFEPEHYIVDAVASFFLDRFRSQHWSILTPVGSLHWNGEELLRGPPAARGVLPAGDGFEAAWRTYYESTFNPARMNPRMMRTEMPKKYWANMPETAAIRPMLQAAPARVREMIEREAEEYAKREPLKAVAGMARQEPRSLEELNRIIAAAGPLVPGATRAVLGEGPVGASIAFVGEQPGDQEDLQGRPFVGPAGHLLSCALAEAKIDRGRAYLTNAVKHFKFERRGKKRIHQTPTAGEVKHYRWWLLKELDFVRPKLVVALGATAALALSGKPVSVGRMRGETRFGEHMGFITVHPSYLLRLPDEAAQESARRAFLADLVRIRELAGGAPAAMESGMMQRGLAL